MEVSQSPVHGFETVYRTSDLTPSRHGPRISLTTAEQQLLLTVAETTALYSD